MKNIPLLRLAAAIALSAAAGAAASGDFPIKEYDLGMPLDALDRERKLFCKPHKGGGVRCSEPTPSIQIATRRIVQQELVFRQDDHGTYRLEHMTFYFFSSNAEDIKLAVSTKFGPLSCFTPRPTAQSSRDNEQCSAAGKSGNHLMLLKDSGQFFGQGTPIGYLTVFTQAELDRSARDNEDAMEKKASDI